MMLLYHVFSAAKAAPASGYDRVTTIPIGMLAESRTCIVDDSKLVYVSVQL